MRKTKGIINAKGFSLLLLLAVTLVTLFGSVTHADYDDWIRPTSISAAGKKSLTMKIGEEKKLRVLMKPLYANDDFLRWKIVSGKKYVRFDDYDRNDDSIALIAEKAGTARVRCYINGKSDQKVTFTIKVKKSSGKKNTIAAKGSTTKYEEVYDDFDLAVRKLTAVSNRYLKWTIADRKIVDFESPHMTVGSDVDFIAKKTGTTTVSCTNTQTKEKISFTIKVVNRYEDSDDNDDFWEYYDD